MDRKQHWDTVYTTKAATEVSWFQDNPALSLDLIDQSGMPKTAALVDIGGGASRLVDTLLAQNYSDVTVLDIAEPALAASKARLGDQAQRVHWIAADITHWQPARHYAMWHDRAVFHFLTDAADRDAYRRALLAGTASGSQIVIASFAPDGPERCSGLPVMRYAPESLLTELGAEFALRDARREEHHTPGGSIQRFQYSCLLRR
ncbi:class I SAM-dependent methyltransferase [Ferrovibrio terrae]|uniref:Class I SAM-dependent methyltransferase n=1 Tax=Ferrovibrio terrae TaxID=2594003 RepID=A0A516H5T5_9PROT|nr:class I SAM-dependent methyltransferase [Ferrovibrio terrae]QDO99112.1 class I SAM-dependent methyltransferase [Ferrovibrio terrae]